MGCRMHACVCGWMDFADVPEIAVFHFVFRGKMMAFESLSWWNPKWWIYHITDFGSNDVFVWRPLFASFLVLSWLLCRLCNLQASYAVECLCMFNFLPSNLCGVFFLQTKKRYTFSFQKSCQTPTMIWMEHRCLWPSFFPLFQERPSFFFVFTFACVFFFPIWMAIQKGSLTFIAIQARHATIRFPPPT